MISLTDEQKEAVRCHENILLSACPGSGKTRVIIAKLLQLAEVVEGTPRSIGCITYTNAAVDEITARIKQAGTNALVDRCEISTIHSFCLSFILRPYQWLAPDVPVGFRILTREMRDFEELVRVVEDEIRRRPTFRIFDDYASLRMDVSGAPMGPGIESGDVTESSARRFWQLMRQRGYIDFSMILFHSYRILRDYSFVGLGLSSRFQWLLVDEFQDTTDVQIEILRLIHTHMRTQFFLVGDEHQSINAFAGARPDLGEEFCHDIGVRRDFSLSGNFRCTPEIIVPAQTLIDRQPAMRSVGLSARQTGTVEYFHVAQPQHGITDYFLPLLEARGIPYGNSAILAPWWQHLVPVARMLREYQVPVFGPGARPYRQSRLYARLAEELGACVESGFLVDPSGVERAVFRLINEAMGQTRFDIFSYHGRRTAVSLIYEARQLSEAHPGGVDWLEQSARVVADLLHKEEWISTEAASALIASVEDMKGDMERRDVDLANLEIADLGLFANPDDAIKLMTLHNAKGREFDALAIIHANDGQIPFWTASTTKEIAEARRLFYVGLTRAKRHLIVLSDQTNSRNPPTRFIAASGLSAQ